LLLTDRGFENPGAVTPDFTVTKVTPDCRGPQYDNGHDPLRAKVMTRIWRNSLEAAAAVGTIVVATLIVHLVMSWWAASAAFQ
jgi:hypothetical protein